MLRSLDLLDQCAPFTVGKTSAQVLLLTTALTDANLFAYYERDATTAVRKASAQFDEALLLIDCGADAGVYSLLALAAVIRPQCLFAVEPNQRSYRVLKHNLNTIDVPTTLFAGALSHSLGQGRLIAPEYVPQDRAGFIEFGVGDVLMTTVDALLRCQWPSARCIPIDVEGAELDVLNGARQSLLATTDFVVQFQAHPQVQAPTGVEPLECLRTLIDLGVKSWICCEEASASRFTGFTSEQPFFDQMPADKILDVVVSIRADTFADGLGLAHGNV